MGKLSGKGYLLLDFVFFAVFIILDFLIKFMRFVRNKNTKIKYLYCRESMLYWILFYAILVAINFIPYVITSVKIVDPIEVNTILNAAYVKIIYLTIMLITIFILQVISGIPIFINDEFIAICDKKVRFDSINYVEIHAKKGITGRRKVKICEEGKIKLKFSIKDKHIDELISIFSGKCRIIV